MLLEVWISRVGGRGVYIILINVGVPIVEVRLG